MSNRMGEIISIRVSANSTSIGCVTLVCACRIRYLVTILMVNRGNGFTIGVSARACICLLTLYLTGRLDSNLGSIAVLVVIN